MPAALLLAGTLLAGTLLAGSVAPAATLAVGPGRTLAAPSAAAAVAQDGDTIAIDPGEYYDCAIWRRNGLTILGSGPGVVVTDRVCAGKALFVVDGDDVTIRGITFARARVPDRNGAGIRAEGRNLALQDDRFLNNEVGLLAGDSPGSVLRIDGCAFIDNGVADADVAGRALLVGRVAELRLEASRFAGTKGEEHVLSGAARTVLLGSSIEDPAAGTRLALLVVAQGGAVVLEEDALRRGPNAARVNAAVLVMRGEGGPGQVQVRRTTLANASLRPLALLLDWSGGEAAFAGTVLAPGDVQLSTEGSLRHWAVGQARGLLGEGRHMAGAAWRAARSAWP